MLAEIEYKEVGNNHTGHTSYDGENLTVDSMIEFFGLDNDDVEWYTIVIDGVLLKSTRNLPLFA